MPNNEEVVRICEEPEDLKSNLYRVWNRTQELTQGKYFALIGQLKIVF